MLGKIPVALQTLIDEYDRLKKDTDSFLKKFKKFKKSNSDVKESETLLTLTEEGNSLAQELESLTTDINALQNKEPKQQKNFDSKKKSVLKKLAALQKLVSDAYDVIVQHKTPKENEGSEGVEITEEKGAVKIAAAKSSSSKRSKQRARNENSNNSSKEPPQHGDDIAGDSEKEIDEDISENLDEQDDGEEDDDEEEDDASTSVGGGGSSSVGGGSSSTSGVATQHENPGKINKSSSKTKSIISQQKSGSEKSPTPVVTTTTTTTSSTSSTQQSVAVTESESSVNSEKSKGLKSKLISDMKSVLKHNFRHKEKLASSPETEKLVEEEKDGEEEEDGDDAEEEEDSDEDDDEEEEKDTDKNDDDGEDEDEESDDEEMKLSAQLFVALSDYEKEEERDLSFKKGEVLTVVQAYRNGWWLAANIDGRQGLVPSTYLQMKSASSEEEDDSSEESGKDEEESDSEEKFEEEEKQKEDEEEEESEEDEDSEIDEDLKVDSGADQLKARSGKQLWQSIKESIQEQSVVDVLQAMGTMPSGFRPSTLSSLWAANSEYRMRKALHPSLSKTAMSYIDLLYSPSDKQICPYNVNILKIVSIQSCRNIPQTGPGVDVQSRCVRVCIFDGKNVLSNIHTVKVQSVDKSKKLWNFSSRVSDNMDISLHAEFFVRTNYSGNHISLLFELCLSYIRQDTQEHGEFSCGWTKLSLTEEAITNRSYDLPLNGGTPYDRGVPLDSRSVNAVEENSFLSLFTGHQKPMLAVKVSPPKKEQKDILSSLPHTIVGNACLMHFYALYRNILAKTLLRDRSDMDNTELISSPVLASFPLVADRFDMMQLLRDTWIEKQKETSRMARRDINCQKKVFIDSFLETVYPLSHSSASILPMMGIDPDQRHYDAIQRFKELKSERGSTLAVLLSDDFAFEPMDLNEVTFSVLKDNDSFKTHE